MAILSRVIYTKCMILGIDEVGRGPWAGPLVVGAVVLGGAVIEGLTDSKKLSKKQREILAPQIQGRADAVALGWVSANELDEIGMSEALRLATRRAVEQITVPFHEIIIDGTINLLAGTSLERHVTTLPKADLLVPSVSAASIVAKVARDAYMAEQDSIYPGYNFSRHAGYGVAAHRAAIEHLGVTPLHRLSFAPLQQYRTDEPVSVVPRASSNKAMTPEVHPTTRAIGNASEAIAVEELQRLGHAILERNWRTRWCEVDIISLFQNTLYFTEVKHRKNDKGGDGFAAITATKLKQMKFAAELYAMKHPGYDLRLAVVATTSDPPQFVDYLELR